MPRIVLWIQPGFQVPGHEPCFSGTPFALKVTTPQTVVEIPPSTGMTAPVT